MEHTYLYKVESYRVIDGDTIEFVIDLGFRLGLKQVFRLLDIDAPEPRGETRIAGLESKAYLQKILVEANEVLVSSCKDGKYGRWLCKVYCDGVDVGQAMVDAGQAVAYE